MRTPTSSAQWTSSPFEAAPNSMPLTFNSQSSSSICAKLVTVNKNGRREGYSYFLKCHPFPLWQESSRCPAVVLSINKPVTIGRNPAAWFVDFVSQYIYSGYFQCSSYVIHDNVVSNVHCKLYACAIFCYSCTSLWTFTGCDGRVRSCTGGIIVSCQVSLRFAVLS